MHIQPPLALSSLVHTRLQECEPAAQKAHNSSNKTPLCARRHIMGEEGGYALKTRQSFLSLGGHSAALIGQVIGMPKSTPQRITDIPCVRAWRHKI